MYERTVNAALGETRGKFGLGEALALDVPRRDVGGNVADEGTVVEWLAEAREAVLTAGGEPRSVETLRRYRATALWVSKIGSEAGNGPTSDLEFRWIDGVSFTAHNEARMAGLSFDDFAAMEVRTVDAVRRRTSGTRSEATERAEANGVLLGGLTPDQQAEVSERMGSDYPVPQRTDDPSPAEESVAHDDVGRERVDRATRFATLLHELSKANLALAASVTELSGLTLDDGETAEIHSYVERIGVKTSWITAHLLGTPTASVDEELQALLRQEG